jgi:hypothetical protein
VTAEYPCQESKPPNETPEKQEKRTGAKTVGADSGSVEPLQAFLATLAPEQRERLAELLNAQPLPK